MSTKRSRAQQLTSRAVDLMVRRAKAEAFGDAAKMAKGAAAEWEIADSKEALNLLGEQLQKLADLGGLLPKS